jgi:hypothetical protein
MKTILLILLIGFNLMEVRFPKNCYKPHDDGIVRVFPTQQRYLKSKKFITHYFGGFGSGKTESLIAKAIDESLSIPNNSGIIAAESYPVLRRGAMRKFEQQLGRLGITAKSKPVSWKYNKSDKIGFFSNGSRITFLHCQDANSLKGSDEGFIAIDELTSISYPAYRNLASRLREHGKAKLFTASNASDPSHWCYDMFIKGNKEAYDKNREIITDKMLVLRALTTENTNLPDTYKLVYDDFSDSDYQKFVMAMWTTVEGLIYSGCYEDERNKIDDLQLNKYRFIKHLYELYISIDPSYHNFAIGYYLVDRDNQDIIKIDEMKYKEKETDYVVSDVMQTLSKHEKEWEMELTDCYVDSANQQVKADITNLTDGKIRPRNAKKDVNDGIITVKSFMKQGKLKIHESCKGTLDDRKAYKYKFDAKRNIYLDEPDKGKYDPHFLDETRYLIHTLFGYKIRGGNVTFTQYGERDIV